MKYIFYTALTFIFLSCKTVKINDNNFLISNSKVDLLSLGEQKSFFDLKHHFNILGYPKLDEKIKLDLTILPYNKSLAKAYQNKMKHDQSIVPLLYNDSLPIKPELIKINVVDIVQTVTELNQDHNKAILNFVISKPTTACLHILTQMLHKQIINYV
jgi:hypothetical protein